MQMATNQMSIKECKDCDAEEKASLGSMPTKVCCFNILGVFLHADIEEDITIVLKGRPAELMVQVAPNLYRKYITADKKGNAILYVKMQNALCGLLRSALLFYKNLWPI